MNIEVNKDAEIIDTAETVASDYNNEVGDKFVDQLKSWLETNATMKQAKKIRPLVERCEYSVGMRKRIAETFI